MKNIILILIFIVIYNLLFYQTEPGIGTGLLFLSLNLYFFFTRNEKSNILLIAVFSSIAATMFAFLFSFRDNDIVQLLNLGTAIFFSLVALYFYKYAGSIDLSIPIFVLLPFITIKNSIVSLFNLFRQDDRLSESSIVNDGVKSSLIRGIAITVPIFAVLLFLLTQADPLFGKLTHDLLSNIGERIIVSSILFIALLGFGLSKMKERLAKEKEINGVSVGKPLELAIITGSILSLFAIFIAIQFRYLFSSVGERELHQLGIISLTYSEYVRKGFFELLITSTIASGVVVYVLRYLNFLKGRQKLLVQVFSGILTVETGLLLLSAVKRLALYADVHGLTRARVFGFVFLLWLAILLANFLFRVLREMKREQFFTSTLAATILALFLVNVVNIDGLIANKYRPTVNNEIDYFYLANLSTDAIDSWKPAFEDSSKIITQLEGVKELSTEDNRKLYWTRLTLETLLLSTQYLINKYGTVEEVLVWHKEDSWEWIQKLRSSKGVENFPRYLIQYRKWQSYNLSEYNAYETIRKDISYFEQIQTLLKRVYILASRVSEEVHRNTPIDRSTEPPLLW